MFEWGSFRGNYVVHKTNVISLSEVLLNHVIFNKLSQQYLAVKNEYD